MGLQTRVQGLDDRTTAFLPRLSPVSGGMAADLALDHVKRLDLRQHVDALKRDIQAFVDASNAEPKPARWVESDDDILASVKRFCLRSLGENTAGQALSQNAEPGHQGSASKVEDARCPARCGLGPARSDRVR